MLAFVDISKNHFNERYDLEILLNDFLIYSNNKMHNPAVVALYRVVRIVNHESQRSNLKLKSQNRRERGHLGVMREIIYKGFRIIFSNLKILKTLFINFQVDFKRI